jgi:hypothetical protein
MVLDLSGVRRVVEKLLDDELQLWRDRDGGSGDELDDATGELRPGGQAELLWQGAGAILRPEQLPLGAPLSSSIAPVPEATAYQALLPMSAPPLRADDLLRVARSVRDDQLVGHRFRVGEVAVGTYAVVRVVRLQPLDEPPTRTGTSPSKEGHYFGPE